jgi:HK97 family phage major capsid protein
MKNAWVSDTVRIVNNGRPTFNLFSRGPLPADGMNVEYPIINTNTLAVGDQAAEGDVLDYGKLTLTSATAPIKTFGGYTDMSRQVVERSSINYVDTAFRAIVAKYAAATNAAAIAKVTAAQNTFNQVSLASFDTDDILEALADASVEVNQNTGLPLQALLVGSTVFKNLAKAVDGSNRPLLSNVGATQNTFGSINPLGLSGNILGLPVVLDPALNALGMFAWNSAALTTYESSGAPFRLNDEEITNLTNSFSVYGYLALTCQEPLAAVRFGGVVGY